MKLKTRILWLCAATLLGLVVLSAMALTTLYQSMMKERTAQLSNLVVLAHAAAQKSHEKEKSGALSREDAIKEATQTIGSFVDKDKYFFVRGFTNDVNYVHPNPKRIGIVDEKGGKEAGVRYRAALQGVTIGTVTAPGTRPGAKEPVDKLYAIIKFEPWDWIIGFGDYVDDIENSFWRNTAILLSIGAVLMLIVALMAWQMLRSLVHQLGGEPQYAADVVTQIAEGNLAVDVQTLPGDTTSILHAIRAMRDNLSHLVKQVRDSTDSINTASSEIAAGNGDLSARTESQASSLEQTAASLEELGSTVQHSANASREASALSQRSAEVARQGNDAMNRVISTMDGISRSSQRIGEIIGVIDGIAFQTNILALNAAVEAARAGEQGRGFAVVAGEVRNLAQRTLSAAKEIKVLIDESSEQVTTGSQLVHSTGKTMSEVVTSAEQVHGLIADITGATQEQAMGLTQINQAVGQLDSVTQQNSAMVEELAAAASSLQAQARVMNDAVRIFRLDSHAHRAPAA